MKAKSSVLKIIFCLAWPTVVEQILTTAVSYVDTAMVGRLGASASAAVGCTMTVNWLLNSLVSAVGVGFLAFIAREMGAGHPQMAKRAAAQAVTLAVLAGLIITVPALLLYKQIPKWMQADVLIQKEASTYFFILYTPMIFRSAIIVFSTVLRASGDTKTPMRVNIATNLINVVLNWFLIYETRAGQLFGESITLHGAGLGVTGAAIASAIAFVIGGFWITLSLYKSRISPRHISLKPDKAILVPCFKVALPSCLQRLATCMGYVVFSGMINGLGAVATAAHSIANTAESAFYIPGWGMQTAASTLIGNAYGAEDKAQMRSLSRMLLIIEFIVMTLSGALLFVFAGSIMRIFTQDEAVIAAGARVLKLVALSEPIYGIAIIIEGIFNGVGDTLHTFIFNALGMWGIRILGAYIFVIRLGGGLTQAWLCMIAHNAALGIMLILRYRYGKWNPLGTERGFAASK